MEQLRSITDPIILRQAGLPNSFDQWSEPKSSKLFNGRPQFLSDIDIAESNAVGTFSLADGTEWTITRMRTKCEAELSTDYDVYRHPVSFESISEGFIERMSVNKREYVLRVCRFDDKVSKEKFMHEYEIMRKIRTENSSRGSSTVPFICAAGCLPQMIFMCAQRDRHELVTFPAPRPFFIMEKLQPPLDWLAKSSKYDYLPFQTAVFVSIGIIKVLRVLHRKGYCHRNVQPSSFALRLVGGSFLRRRECELADMVVMTDLAHCRQFKGPGSKKPRRAFTSTFSPRYSSPAAMSSIDQTSGDDLLSALYVFVELATGFLPWAQMEDLQAIKLAKLELEQVDDYRGRELKDETLQTAAQISKQKQKQKANENEKEKESSGVKTDPEKKKKDEQSKSKTASNVERKIAGKDEKKEEEDDQKIDDEMKKMSAAKVEKGPPCIASLKSLFEIVHDYDPFCSMCDYYKLYKELVERIPETKESFSLFGFLSNVDAVYGKHRTVNPMEKLSMETKSEKSQQKMKQPKKKVDSTGLAGTKSTHFF